MNSPPGASHDATNCAFAIGAEMVSTQLAAMEGYV